jgi:uncharacterized protein YjbI with pentapeptide repeats
MKFQIKHRWSSEVKFECELETKFESERYGIQLGAAIKAAYKSGADLRDAVLRDADLRGADLRGADLRDAVLRDADLSGADLSDADLSDADLSDADLRGADLRDAVLRGADLSGADLRDAVLRDAVLRDAVLRDADLSDADLRGADLRDADLRDAVLRGADLSDADLSDADLRGADLRGAVLREFKNDLFSVLLRAPHEVDGLALALKEGRVDGSAYEGECACLVGTIANLKHCSHTAVPGLAPDSNRPAERWFLGINRGDTAETNQIVKITLEWIEEFQSLMAAAMPEKV